MPRHTTKPLKISAKQTMADLWECAMGIATEAAAEAAERMQLNYKAAFTLLKYMERYTWNCMMSIPLSKGWYTRLYRMAIVEADRLAYKIARAERTVNEEERKQLIAELDTELRRL